MSVPDDAPPLAIYCSPYGGLGLKTKSFMGARKRIEGLLAQATEVELRSVELCVIEECSRKLVERLVGPLDHETAMRGGGRDRDLGEEVAASGHAHGDLVSEAWQRFGAPGHASGHQNRGQFWVEWQWEVDEVARARSSLDAWSPYVAAHDQVMWNDRSTMVGVRAIWEGRLRVSGGRVVASPYPPSRIHAHLCGRYASAFLDLVLPHEAKTEAFLADYHAVNQALGMTVPMGGYKLCTRKKRGTGRVYRRLPPAEPEDYTDGW
ncbi:MAG: hypothetical protein HS111_00820 [Kofleriaceae bacterium]|nr:hypothetical protein [Kofleriaceae bacterium]MCL4226115.1 hypothetical protein [Myxococcales bacterium]